MANDKLKQARLLAHAQRRLALRQKEGDEVGVAREQAVIEKRGGGTTETVTPTGS